MVVGKVRTSLKVLLLLCFSIALVGFLSSNVSAVDCGAQTAQTDCEAAGAGSECSWWEDPWGSWCSPKSCGNLWTSTECTNSSNLINKSCSWSSGSSGWCMEANCWALDGTNQSDCEANSYGIDCTWTNECMGPYEKQCWAFESSAECTAVAGCTWGMCSSQGCYDYTASATCVANTGYTGNACKWNSQYDYCYEGGCNDYSDSISCAANDCFWSGGGCYNPSCSDYGYNNESYCESNDVGLSCQWNDPWCEEKGCWSSTSSGACAAANSSSGRSCVWDTSDTGWCEEIGCWNWESWNSGSEAACLGNGTAYGLSCIWSNDSVADDGTGWCYQNTSSTGCSTLTIDRDCMDTFYCMWNYTASACQEPGTGSMETTFSAWYPGCYIFDTAGQSACGNVTGCDWIAGEDIKCRGNATINSTDSSIGGIRCEYINNSNMCKKMTMMPSCCEWQGEGCVENKFTSACWDDMQDTPEGADYCEDYNAYTDKTLCEQIAGEPWYMPCRWNNQSTVAEDDDRCTFKFENVFEVGKENVMFLDSKQSCEAAGGNWITDTYCSSNDAATAVALPVGRCEYKFNEERNCDKECYACDYKTDGTNWTNAQKAKDACISSVLGICGFTSDTTKPNGFGTCDPKEEFKTGIATNCDEDCGSCTHMGDSTASDADNKPSAFCKSSKKTGGCKWIPDIDSPTDEAKGRCASKAEKTCESKCDLCFDETNCVNKGSKNGNTTLDTQCSWNDNLFMCLPTSGADQMEVCWDGIDNNNNGKMDCADSMCFSDPFCGAWCMAGFGGMDCFGYDAQTDCEGGGCVWINENWGSWCDMPGSNCWSNDGNQTLCEADGNCSWHSGFGGFCEDDWSSTDSCMNLDNVTCGNSTGVGLNCTWVVDSYFSEYGDSGSMGWCDPNWNFYGDWPGDNYCQGFSDDGESTCGTSGTVDVGGNYPCQWFNSSGGMASGGGGEAYGGGWCDHRKYACHQFQDQSDCEDQTNASYNHSEFCYWQQDDWGGWCDGKMMGGSDNSDSCWNNINQTDCEASSCNWVEGFCDPAGFGSDSGFGGVAGGTGFGGSGGGGGGGGSFVAMGGFGMNCMQHDGNQTGCELVQGCGWMAESNPTCSVSFASQCPQYSYNATLCNEQSKCVYDPNNNFCDEKVFSCFWNSSLNTQTPCEATGFCYWSDWNSCEPLCYNSSLTSGNCGTATATNGSLAESVCSWNDGWCNPGAASTFFKEMEGGAPIPLGTDTSGDATPPEVDIVDFGMKDMGPAFGFGIRVLSVENASMCNGIMGPGGMSGTGKNETKFYWYLDTDDTRTGGCAIQHDATQVGYEFYFKSAWSWSSSGEAVESTEAYQCSSNTWQKAPIPISSVKQKACQEVGGGTIAVQKTELEKFPTLYTSGSDIRVTVATASALGNITNPADNISSDTVGYATPGAFDQDIDVLDLFKFKSNTSDKVGQGASKGYVSYDDIDCWTAAGCADYQCMGHPYCTDNTYGVEAASFVDTRVPKVIGLIKESYPDAALITFFTDKPSNGSLELFGSNAGCPASSIQTVVNDTGVDNAYVRDFRLWHMIELNSDTLGSAMTAGTEYYYKLIFCDENDKCGISKCSKMVVENTTDSCAFCDFVTKVDVPTGWNVSYDLDQDGTYEHVQGTICGANAGMKTNYTDGRRANIKLVTADNASWFEFIDVKLTKTGLGTKTRSISTTGAINVSTTTDAAGNSLGFAGMVEDTRDKIVHNLYPERCLIKIPKGDTNCDDLWHCDNTLTNCVNRTSEATLNLSETTSCIWEIPYCEFSAWAGGEPAVAEDDDSSSSSSSGGGGGGGGGGGNTTTNATTTDDESDDEEDDDFAPPTGAATSETKKSSLSLPSIDAEALGDWRLIVGIIAVIAVIGYGMSRKKSGSTYRRPRTTSFSKRRNLSASLGALRDRLPKKKKTYRSRGSSRNLESYGFKIRR